MSPMPRYGKMTDLEVFELTDDVEKGGTALIWWLSRCSKLITYMNLIKKVMHFKCLYALFWPVCPALIGRVARYTPSSELDIQTKIWHRII